MKKLIPAYQSDLGTLEASGDSGSLKTLAHRIKGEGGNIGAMKVKHCAEALEWSAFEDSSEVSEACVRLQVALNELAECIDHGRWR
jgi:HPt (histidine-containing phosphotransfer) domain-containing protein